MCACVCRGYFLLIGFFNVLHLPPQLALAHTGFPADPAPPSYFYLDRRQGGIFAQDRSLFHLTIGLNLLFKVILFSFSFLKGTESIVRDFLLLYTKLRLWLQYIG